MVADSEQPLRVLHCPKAVGGHAVALATAERALGLDSRCVTYEKRYFDYPADEVLWREGQGPVSRQLACWGLLRRALRDFDVIHFNYGSAILQGYIAPDDPRLAFLPGALRYAYATYGWLTEFVDVRLLRAAGKAIVVTYQGDDARQEAFCREHFAVHASDEVEDGYYIPSVEHRKQRRIDTFGRLAGAVFSLNPDLMHVLPASAHFMPYASVDLEDWQPVGVSTPPNRQPIITHAPSHRGVKGTRFLLQAVEQLRREGLDFELRLVEGMSRAEARRTYEQTDLFVDQLLLGWYGGVAVELMALGKPVVAYIRDQDLGFIPDAMRDELPILVATPETITDVLRNQLTQGRLGWPARGERGRRFVERWHDPARLARQTRDLYLTLTGSTAGG